MMVPIDTLPAIIKLLGDTEQQLQRITKLHIKLRMEVLQGQALVSTNIMYTMLQEAVCEASGLSWRQVIANSRRAKLVLARQAYCWFARHCIGGRTLRDIGNDLGGLDHTTVMHSIKAFQTLLDIQDPQAKDLVTKVNKRLQHHESKTNQAAI